MADKIKFIVIGSGRSGTGLLRPSIDSHPDITCLGEILHPGNAEGWKRLHKFIYRKWFNFLYE